MPAADFASYHQKVEAASRRADPNATAAQRAAGVARVGKVFAHGLEISIEYPKGATRRGTGGDGKPWSRTVSAPYGYINGTRTASDGEQLDVWLGDHPGSQLGFLVTFLDADGNFDEYKACLMVRNLAEAKTLITANYPPDFWDDRVGEVRGFFLADLKKHLGDKGLMKTKRRKAAAPGFWCQDGKHWVTGRTADDGCPECDESEEKTKKAVDWGRLTSVLAAFAR